MNWKPIKISRWNNKQSKWITYQYPEYEVSDTGIVREIKTQQEVPRYLNNGEWKVTLNTFVHPIKTIVLESFQGRAPSFTIRNVKFVNNDKNDLRLANLYYSK